MVVPASEPVPCPTSSMSRTMPSKSAVASGWKTIAALPALCCSSVISSVTYAVLIANSRSGAGCARLRLPRRMSSRPMPRRLRGALQLRLEALQRGEALLHRRVRGEEAGQGLARLGREDVEGRQLARRAQVALRDALHAAGDL